MADNLTPEQRRRCMQRVRTAGTGPELAVRALLRELGHSYRTKNPDLPGRPDLANRSAGWAIFVHGCFWHGHRGCSRACLPATNHAFWARKIRLNVQRDRAAQRQLRARQYRFVVVWQCDLRRRHRLRDRITAALRK